MTRQPLQQLTKLSQHAPTQPLSSALKSAIHTQNGQHIAPTAQTHTTLPIVHQHMKAPTHKNMPNYAFQTNQLNAQSCTPNPNQCQNSSTNNQTQVNSNPPSKPKFNKPNHQYFSTTITQHPCNPILPSSSDIIHAINPASITQVHIDSNNPHPFEHLCLQFASIKSILDNTSQLLNEQLFTWTTNNNNSQPTQTTPLHRKPSANLLPMQPMMNCSVTLYNQIIALHPEPYYYAVHTRPTLPNTNHPLPRAKPSASTNSSHRSKNHLYTGIQYSFLTTMPYHPYGFLSLNHVAMLLLPTHIPVLQRFVETSLRQTHPANLQHHPVLHNLLQTS